MQKHADLQTLRTRWRDAPASARWGIGALLPAAALLLLRRRCRRGKRSPELAQTIAKSVQTAAAIAPKAVEQPALPQRRPEPPMVAAVGTGRITPAAAAAGATRLDAALQRFAQLCAQRSTAREVVWMVADHAA